MRRPLTAIILAAACAQVQAHPQAPAPAQSTVARIEAMLAEPDTLCGRFDQTKRLAGMKRPLLSHGRFCVVAGKGVMWRTVKPFPNTLRLTRDEIVHFQGQRVAMRLDARQEPTVRMINSVLFSLLSGDLGKLDALFEVDASIDKGWKVALKARSPALAKAVGAISLDGAAHVNNIHIKEAGGDSTDIVFSAIKTGDTAITADEAALF
ncbi:LolA family protein [Massilia glaciei]|uniref:Outer membrane lipoprotein carrier protein LolA n=1 Tax=Massilia glaciei TaxID=1524097 RepID=A0A2U2HE03_9BURK|nr:outer membrane lipoprotein carrier protein LolA [Massilia glaciei]PWF41553.1 outer membrane lipoprotein carrier protein LolA [Massilia glaciei]